MELNDEQKQALEKIWFIDGNGGRKSTMQNHKLIQGFIQYGEDRRDFYIQGNKNLEERFNKEYVNKHGLTDECLLVVNLILDNKIDRGLEKAQS